MDVKKFGVFVMLLGLGTLGWGVVQYATNQPVTAHQAPAGDWRASLNNLGGQVDAMGQNYQRADRQEKAGKIILAGGVVVLVGYGLRASSKS